MLWPLLSASSRKESAVNGFFLGKMYNIFTCAVVVPWSLLSLAEQILAQTRRFGGLLTLSSLNFVLIEP